MRRTCWAVAALTFLALDFGTLGVSDARAQWVEVSKVRYGLLGRPRSVATYVAPTVSALPTTYVAPTRYVIDQSVVATSYVATTPTALVVPTTRYVSAVPAAIPSTYGTTVAYPVAATSYVPAAPVYVPSTRIVGTRAIVLP